VKNRLCSKYPVNFVELKILVLLLDMVDNSTSPCKLVSGAFFSHSTVQAGRCILEAYLPPAFTFTKPPTAISRGVYLLHSRSQFEAWHRRQRKTEHFPRGPATIGFPRCQSFRTLPVTLRCQLATPLSRLHECYP
jgi:hypothetical protein